MFGWNGSRPAVFCLPTGWSKTILICTVSRHQKAQLFCRASAFKNLATKSCPRGGGSYLCDFLCDLRDVHCFCRCLTEKKGAACSLAKKA